VLGSHAAKKTRQGQIECQSACSDRHENPPVAISTDSGAGASLRGTKWDEGVMLARLVHRVCYASASYGAGDPFWSGGVAGPQRAENA